MRLKRPAGRYLLAALSGATGVLCFAPGELFWLAPAVWLAFFVLLRGAATTRQAALTGYGFGLGFFLAGVSWVYVSLAGFGGLPGWMAALAALAFAAFLALYPMLAGAAFKRWQPPGELRQALFFAALVALADWLRSWLLTGFPWLVLGYTQTPPSPLAGFAPIIGVHGLSLLVAFAGALCLRWRRGIPALFVLCACGFGLRQIAWTEPDGPPIRVALAQGNIPQDMKFEPEAFIHTLRLYLDIVEKHPADLNILPETALPAFVDELPDGYLDLLRDAAARHNGDVITGVVTGSLDKNYWNSAISVGSSPAQTYRKNHLVPFGETVPPGFAWFMQMTSIPFSSFARGAENQAPLAVAGRQVAVNICYEDAFGEEIIRALPQAGILANLSNTAWFGHSLAQPQHLQISRMRAAETGRPMLRATNTGMTAIIAADGQLQAVLEPFTAGVLEGQVSAYRGTTPFVRWGNGAFLVLALIALLVARPRRQP